MMVNCQFLILMAAAQVSLTSCNRDKGFSDQTEPVPQARYGYLVLSRDATAYNMTPGDTLFELRPGEITAKLRSLTDNAGHPVGTKAGPYDVRCTRYFSAGPSTVVVGYSIKCPVQAEVISDNFIPVVFTLDRDGIFKPLLQARLYPKVVPFSRNVRGDAIQLEPKG